jgi:hypothetical protein
LGGIAGELGRSANRDLTALTLLPVFLALKGDCWKGRVLNREEVKIMGKNSLSTQQRK